MRRLRIGWTLWLGIAGTVVMVGAFIMMGWDVASTGQEPEPQQVPSIAFTGTSTSLLDEQVIAEYVVDAGTITEHLHFVWNVVDGDTSMEILRIPADGPATGSGEPCTILVGLPPPPVPEPHRLFAGTVRALNRMWLQSTMHAAWQSPAELEDGKYVGMLRVEGGKVIPCRALLGLSLTLEAEAHD